MIEPGQIVKNLIATEPVKITGIRVFGDNISLKYVGMNTSREDSIVISNSRIESLELVSVTGQFEFNGDPHRFLLFAEAERINSAYQFDPLFAVNCSIVDPLPHQVEAVYRFLLPLPKIRFLLADDTGAGKTIMAGLLIKELMSRGIVERILIITPGGLTKQWKEDEMGLKFNLDFKLVNRAIFESEPTVFNNSQRVVTSLDFIRAEDVMTVLKEVRWDMVIVDEAHKLSAFDYGNKRYASKRYEAVETLAQLCEHLLLLTATPHRGRKDTFRNLLKLLDEDIFSSDEVVTSRIREYEENGINKFFIRRLKEDMKDWNNNPLFKLRFTKTTQYVLTADEKRLYDAVTRYLLEKREAAKQQNNIHVELTLMVMQRRLTSSIFAITKTLKKRHQALQSLVVELNHNPGLFKKAQSFADINVDEFTNFDDFDELTDDERERLEGIFSDPRKFKLFTTAKSIHEVKDEADQVKILVEIADSMEGIEEQKYIKLKELLASQGVLDKNEKLVIFTEHKDTLNYLELKLSNQGYKVATIHGSKDVDERREAQTYFARDAQILLATDAAGEGINLQFCRLLINWDIPWNPNRLEQRMGRIHRYGQKNNVTVFNLVAQNTREGMVLQRLLSKLDLIREQMGDDRVYDVISDIFENVSMDQILRSTFDGQDTTFDSTIDGELTKENVEKKIAEQKNRLSHSSIDFKLARSLKEDSDEKRLQPIYIRLFFEKAFKALGGEFTELRSSIFRIEKLPDIIINRLKRKYNIASEVKDILFCFDKQVFFDYQSMPDLGKIHYINPGNPVFDVLVEVIREQFKEDMLKGTVLVSPDDKESYFAFYVKSQIVDNRTHRANEAVADERLAMVYSSANGFKLTSPAKYIDLKAPSDFAKVVTPPQPQNEEEVVAWAFHFLTEPQMNDTRDRVIQDCDNRSKYLREAFSNLIMDITAEINELDAKIQIGNVDLLRKRSEKQKKIDELKFRMAQRLQELEGMKQLSPKEPEILGCAYVIPLSEVEYKGHFGMSRDDEAEAIAMQTAMEYELSQGWKPEDVSANNEGYDIRSMNFEYLKRYIEVKGRSVDGNIMVSENEFNRLSQLGDSAWLYIVTHCKSNPELFRIQNPAKNLRFDLKSKGIQYLLAMDEWKSKII